MDKTPRWNTAKADFYHISKELKKHLRKNETLSEKILWEEVRNKNLGFKFRRQHIIDVFIVDFVCISEKLVVEVDGRIHLSQKDYDLCRTEYLNELGFRVIRVTNQEVLNEMDKVLKEIRMELEKITDLDEV